MHASIKKLAIYHCVGCANDLHSLESNDLGNVEYILYKQLLFVVNFHAFSFRFQAEKWIDMCRSDSSQRPWWSLGVIAGIVFFIEHEKLTSH